MERSHRELSIDTGIHRRIFKNNQITLFPCFAVPKKKQKRGLIFTVNDNRRKITSCIVTFQTEKVPERY